MDGYIFMRTVSDWDELNRHHASGEVRAVVRTAAGSWDAIVAFVNKTPAEVSALKTSLCQSPATNCMTTYAIPPIIILPFNIFPWLIVNMIEFEIDPARTLEFLEFARAEGIGAITSLTGSLTHHVFGEVTHEDEAEVARITTAITSHAAVRSYRVSVSSKDMMLGHGLIGQPGG